MKNRRSLLKNLISLVLLAVLLLPVSSCLVACFDAPTPEQLAEMREILDSYGSADNYIIYYTRGIAFGEDGRFVTHWGYEGESRSATLRCSDNGIYECAYFGEERVDETFKILLYDYETFTPTVLFEAAMPEGGWTVISHLDGNFYVRADNGERGRANEDWYYLCDMETGTLRRLSEEEEPPSRMDNVHQEHSDGTYYAWTEGTSFGDILTILMSGLGKTGTCLYVRDERTGEVKVIDEETVENFPVVKALIDKGAYMNYIGEPFIKDREIYLICHVPFGVWCPDAANIILRYDFESETLEYYAHNYIHDYDDDGLANYESYKGESRYLVIT